MGKFKLIESERDLLSLKLGLAQSLPRSGQMFNVITHKLRGAFTPENPVDFYLYFRNEEENEDSFKNPFIVTFQFPNIWAKHGIFVFAPLSPDEEMMEAFESLIPWEEKPVFCTINSELLENYVKGLCVKHDALIPGTKFHFCELNAIMDLQVAMDYPDFLDPSQKIELRPISPSDIGEIVQNYEIAQAHSPRLIKLTIENVASCALYVNGEIASWSVASSVGLLNILHTKDKFRRRGFGVMVLKSLAKTVASMGIFPIAENEPWNDASRMTQRKAGFTYIGNTNWTNLTDH